jgi:hypothetical protein
MAATASPKMPPFGWTKCRVTCKMRVVNNVVVVACLLLESRCSTCTQPEAEAPSRCSCSLPCSAGCVSEDVESDVLESERRNCRSCPRGLIERLDGGNSNSIDGKRMIFCVVSL